MLTAIAIPADPAEPARLEQLDKRDVDAFQAIFGGHLQVLNLERPASLGAVIHFLEKKLLTFDPRCLIKYVPGTERL